jgi:hypothetical protein
MLQSLYNGLYDVLEVIVYVGRHCLANEGVVQCPLGQPSVFGKYLGLLIPWRKLLRQLTEKHKEQKVPSEDFRFDIIDGEVVRTSRIFGFDDNNELEILQQMTCVANTCEEEC